VSKLAAIGDDKGPEEQLALLVDAYPALVMNFVISANEYALSHKNGQPSQTKGILFHFSCVVVFPSDMTTNRDSRRSNRTLFCWS
jgi:hypothetical protein